jgi:glycosyltransferase involved in cell wall biosynthesis
MGAGFSICWNFVSYRNWVFTWHPVTAAGPEYPEIVPDLVSIIIPAYNESRRLPRRLERLAAEALQRFPAEIVVVNDGSSDNTGILMEEIASRHSIVRCLHHDVNMGKGAAVRTGMLASRGEYTVFVDADETFSIDHIEKVVRELQNGHKVAIGARRLEGGGRVAGESPLRYIMGKAFNFYVQTMVLAGVSDTQCGLKGFHGQVARQVFPRQRMNGFAFDVEILALVRELGYEMVMVPVQAEDCDGSSVNRWLSPLQMAWDVLSIKTGLLFDYYDLPSRRQWLPQLATASALFVTALAVRIPWLWSIPRYIDELKEVNLAYSIYTGKLLPLTNMAHDIGSMHNYILAGIFKLFGASIYWPRLYVAVTAALTVVLVYRVGEKLFDRWTVCWPQLS